MVIELGVAPKARVDGGGRRLIARQEIIAIDVNHGPSSRVKDHAGWMVRNEPSRGSFKIARVCRGRRRAVQINGVLGGVFSFFGCHSSPLLAMIVNRLIEERNNTWTHEWAPLVLLRQGPSRG